MVRVLLCHFKTYMEGQKRTTLPREDTENNQSGRKGDCMNRVICEYGGMMISFPLYGRYARCAKFLAKILNHCGASHIEVVRDE